MDTHDHTPTQLAATPGGPGTTGQLRLPPRMCRTCTTNPQFTGHTWRCSPAPGMPALDTATLTLAADHIRIVVCDPAHNQPDNSTRDILPATAVATAVASQPGTTPTQALAAANTAIHQLWADRPITTLKGRPIVAAAVVDLHTDGRLQAARAGNCQVWTKPDSTTWQPLLTGDAFTSAGLNHYRQHVAPTKHTDRAAHLKAHDPLWTPELCATTPLGAAKDGWFQHTRQADVRQVVVTTDGLADHFDQPAGSQLDNLDHTLIKLTNRTPPEPHPHPHGDIAVAHTTRRT